METIKLSNEEMVIRYKAEVLRLSAYIPWFEAKYKNYTQEFYQNTDTGRATMPVPTYDSILLQFIREVQNNKFVDRNYAYLYTRHRLKDVRDEKRYIDGLKIEHMDDIYSIISKYVLKGRTQGSVWTEGVNNGIFLHAILKMKDLIEFQEGLRHY